MIRGLAPARLLLSALLLAGCPGGDTDPTDSDVDTAPEGCEVRYNADTFDLQPTAVGEESDVAVEIISACGEDITLSFEWREPNSGAFLLPDELQADPDLLLEAGATELVRITFAPQEAGNYDQRLTVGTDNVAVGGVVLRFRGEGT